MTRAGDAALLARHGFRVPDRALQELPEGWRDDPRWETVLTQLGEVADPDAALRRLRRLGAEAVERVLKAPASADGLLALLGFSEYLTDVVARTPGLVGELLGEARTERSDVREFRDAEIVHIAAADLLGEPGEACFRSVGKALADLADECVRRVLVETASDPPMAVMAMGKYGGEELNYASDIDVLFVVRDAALEPAERS
ncbi:MAG: hypothetical protein ACRDKJ_00240, partial [Actinomycetota bacterium]